MKNVGKLKLTNTVKLLIYIGIALVLIGGASFAYLNFFIEGEETNLVKAGCLEVSLTEKNNLNLTNQAPMSDDEGKEGVPYTFTLTNTCNLEAYYETSFNILTTSTEGNEDKVKLYLTGDNYFEPSLVSSFRIVELIDKPSDVSTSYLIDSGYLKQGQSKTFNLRMWIDYDVTSFDGSFDARVIVTSVADKGPSFKEKTTGYQVLGRNGITSSTLVNPNYSLTSPNGTNQTSGLYKIQGINGDYTYYFRGSVDNYFKFGKYEQNTSVTYKNASGSNVTVNHSAGEDILWRIVRINEDGSLRLILDDFIGTSTFNNDTSIKYYDESLIKTNVDNWYDTHLKNNYEQYIVSTNLCLNKTSKVINSVTYYDSYIRNITNNNPSLSCDSSDIYVSKIGLLSADELALAGNVYNTKNVNNYLYKNVNGWYTISPGSLPNNEFNNIVSMANSSIDVSVVTEELAVRPVISIGSNYLLKGAGTSSNPYEISGKIKDSVLLTIDTNGGTYDGLTNPKYTLIEGEKMILSTPIKDDYELSGWTIVSGDGSISGNVFTSGKTASVIQANWEVAGRTLTLNLDGGTTTDSSTMSIKKGNTVTLAVPTKESYTFAGWDVSGTDLTTSGDTITMGEVDATAKAKWVLTTNTYDYTGSAATYSAIPGSYKLEVYGAQGGSYSTTYAGGQGGYATGVLTLTDSSTLYVYVGGAGASSGTSTTGALSGGYNGGGKGYSSSTNYLCSAGGGGTDIRINDSSSLYARVIVAGGGGGSCSYTSSYRYSGGAGGGTSGSSGSQYSTSYPAGGGGTATATGTSYYGSSYVNSTSYGTPASFGTGGSAASSSGVAGGGGGWYGGGYARRASGGGGSGYVYTESTASQYPSGCLLNSSYYLTDTSMTSGTRLGNGYAVITVVSINY